jgi:hypothetical protein
MIMKKFLSAFSIFLISLTGISSSVLHEGDPEQSEKFMKFGSPNQLLSGVNIHFTKGREKDLDMIAAAGLKFIRMDLVWHNIERTRGVYSWEDYDELTAGLEKRGINAIYILDYSNPLYEEMVESKDPLTGEEQKGIAAPQHKESVEAFTRWATAAAERYKEKHIIWEIWNEPNITFWRPAPDISQYITLAMSTCKAIKAAVPEAVIIGPATSRIPYEFIETFLASGILRYIDGVSVHPYRDYSLSPESAGTDYDKLNSMIEKHTPPERKNIRLISSEWGYASATKGISTEKQAEFIVRMQLFNLYKGLPVSIWYDWKNDGESPGNFEHNCGTVTYDLKPKPAYNAIQVMNKELKSYTFLKRIDSESSNDFILLFRNDKGNYKMSAWTTEKEHSVFLKSIPGKQNIKAKDGKDQALKLKSQEGSLVLDLTNLPQYITLPKGMEVGQVLP